MMPNEWNARVGVVASAVAVAPGAMAVAMIFGVEVALGVSDVVTGTPLYVTLAGLSVLPGSLPGAVRTGYELWTLPALFASLAFLVADRLLPRRIDRIAIAAGFAAVSILLFDFPSILAEFASAADADVRSAGFFPDDALDFVGGAWAGSVCARVWRRLGWIGGPSAPVGAPGAVQAA